MDRIYKGIRDNNSTNSFDVPLAYSQYGHITVESFFFLNRTIFSLWRYSLLSRGSSASHSSSIFTLFSLLPSPNTTAAALLSIISALVIAICGSLLNSIRYEVHYNEIWANLANCVKSSNVWLHYCFEYYRSWMMVIFLISIKSALVTMDGKRVRLMHIY